MVRQISRVPDAESDLTHHLELHDTGYLDSLGIVALTAQIEQTFGITLAEEDLFDPRFTTISGIATIIHCRQITRSAG
jgi:acyl carrier protein